MSCVNPMTVWLSAKTNPKTGKRPITFKVSEALWANRPMEIPCRKCIGCMLVKKAEWSVRCYHESLKHEQNCFVTLTYADPAPPHLEQRVLSDFFRRLRRAGNKFRYYACGEYGDVTRRPHYHALIFGMDFLGGAYELGEGSYYSPVLEAAWGLGHCQVGSFTMGSACYVAGYVSKKMGDPDSFQVMSRRPGIGHDWLDRYFLDIATSGFVVIDGIKLPIPARYLEWMVSSDDPEVSVRGEAIKRERKQFVESMTTEEREARKASLPSKEVNYLAKSQSPRKKL